MQGSSSRKDPERGFFYGLDEPEKKREDEEVTDEQSEITEARRRCPVLPRFGYPQKGSKRIDGLLYHAGKFKAKNVQISSMRPPQSIADLFGLNRKRDKLTLLKRVRFLSDVPAAYTINYQSIENVDQEKKRDEHDRLFEHCRCHLS